MSVRRTIRLAHVITYLAATAAFGQTGGSPHFEVASIKPGGGVFSTRPDRTVGRIRWTTQLCYLAGYAYNLDFSRVTGPKCSAIYAIDATFDPAASDDQVRLMVQSLLADRFKMQSHRVSAEADGYALVVAKGGAKVKEAKEGADPPELPEWVKGATPALRAQSYISAVSLERGVVAITGRKVSMAQLAQTLSRNLGKPVWDRTGLPGNYYFEFRYAGIDANPDADAPPLAAALQESIGLRLKRQRGPVETLVIDQIQEPSEN